MFKFTLDAHPLRRKVLPESQRQTSQFHLPFESGPLGKQIGEESVKEVMKQAEGEGKNKKLVVLVTRAPKYLSNWMQFEDPSESNSLFMAQEWNERITPKMGPFISRREKRRLNAIDDFCEFAKNGYTDRIEKYLKYGSLSEYDVNSPNSVGETALYLACSYGHEQVVLKLLELEHLQVSKPHVHTLSTPLHAAIEKGRERIVALLLANGASFSAQDKNLQTPVELAKIKNHEKIERMLDEFIKSGAKDIKALTAYLPVSHWEVRHGMHWDRVPEELDIKLSELLSKGKSMNKLAPPVSLTLCDQVTRKKVEKVDLERMELHFSPLDEKEPRAQFRRNPEYRL
eukprot:TRINITY_DN5395_c0_g1_i4.p1 TRINITY_DN5395_c0_g1~~TRINITY_DN5395_c0_g1_i4.p1  ORF type:complete len:343 (+),score=72.02 TRINITY_DN5395_c0_g1_i4:393-1421(+)